MIELVPHLLHSPGAVRSVAVEAERTESGLRLRYLLTGDLNQVRVPLPVMAGRADELWQTTCFEAFVRAGGEDYAEYNFSPSGEWAAYGFTGYREGMAEAPAEVDIASTREGEELTVIVDLAADIPPHSRLALAAVVEENDGRKSYWALTHRAGPPDFHHETCFALPLSDIAAQ